MKFYIKYPIYIFVHPPSLAITAKITFCKCALNFEHFSGVSQFSSIFIKKKKTQQKTHPQRHSASHDVIITSLSKVKASFKSVF